MTPRLKKFLYRCFVWGVPTFFILLTLFADFLPVILGIPALVTTGWIFYIVSSLREAIWNWEAILSGLLFLAISVGGFHWLAQRIFASRNKTWEWGWSASIAIMFLSLFAVSIAVGGIVHHGAWLAQSPWISASSDRPTGRQISNARQCMLEIVQYADQHGGRYPDRLDDLITSGSMIGFKYWEEITQYSWPRGAPLSPWIYVNGLSFETPRGLPVLIAPSTLPGGSRVIAFRGGASMMTPARIRERLPQWKQDYAALGLPVPPVLLQYEQSPAASP